MSVSAHHFDEMFASADDPWGFRSRWYEQRKREITLACLPQTRYRNAFEPGCANGELAARLATRSDALLVCDISPRAIALARQRLKDAGNVRVAALVMPQQWPEETFDLIVLSEVCYYLDPAALVELAHRAASSLAPDGTLLACHWRPMIAGCACDGDIVHETLDREMGLTRLLRHLETDFVLDVWSHDGLSVGNKEGLT